MQLGHYLEIILNKFFGIKFNAVGHAFLVSMSYRMDYGLSATNVYSPGARVKGEGIDASIPIAIKVFDVQYQFLYNIEATRLFVSEQMCHGVICQAKYGKWLAF